WTAEPHWCRRKRATRCRAAPFLPRMLQDIRETDLNLLQFDGAAGIFDLLLELLSLVLVDAFLDRLRGALDQRLGFAEAKPGDRADFLDDVDLLATVAGQDDVEFGLLFSGRAGSSGGGRRSGNRGGGGNAPLLFERLGEIRGFEDGQFGKLVDQLGDVSHL